MSDAINEPNTLVVFSGKSLDHVLQDGGSQSWKLDRNNAKHCTYLVCCRSGVNWVEGPEPRGSAFLVGRISDVVPSTEPDCPSRWLVKISEFARVDIPDVWQGWRNPVRYTDLGSLGINLNTLTFEPMPEVVPRDVPPVAVKQTSAAPLTINEAKRGLALNFGVPPEAIEITIRG